VPVKAERHLKRRLLTLLCAGVLLFVVLFPYTPTPIATVIGKILVAAFVFFGCVARAIAVESSARPFVLRPRSLHELSPDDLLTRICVLLI
jgi:hypothetical protein